MLVDDEIPKTSLQEILNTAWKSIEGVMPRDVSLSLYAREKIREYEKRTSRTVSMFEFTMLSRAQLEQAIGSPSADEIQKILSEEFGWGLSDVSDTAVPFEVSVAKPEYTKKKVIKRASKSKTTVHRPITEVDLSVRSRHCLQKMGIMTLGNLANTTEDQLLASLNFGATSMVEIKDLLAEYGLALKQPLSVTTDTPISNFHFNVRARKAMYRLSCATIGDIVKKSAAEFRAIKSFGAESLAHVRYTLAEYGLLLRDDNLIRERCNRPARMLKKRKKTRRSEHR